MAWPAVALNSLQVFNNILDRGFIGRLEPSALAAQSASMNVMFLMFSLAMALATAATALVSRAFGAKDEATLHSANRQCLALSAVMGLLLMLGTWLIAPWAARGLLPPQDARAIELMVGFLAIYATALPALNFIQVFAGALRGIGDTKSPMRISGLQIVLHVLLNFLLIFPTRRVGGLLLPGAGWGLYGAAAALSISAWIAAAVYLLFSPRTPLGPAWHAEWPVLGWVRRILRIAVPAAAMSVLRVAQLAVFTIILKETTSDEAAASLEAAGKAWLASSAALLQAPVDLWLPASQSLITPAAAAIGAMGVGFALESIMFMPAFGLSVAAAALVGQSLGMRSPERAERLAWTASHHAGLVTLVLSAPIFLLAGPITSILVPDNQWMADEAVSLIRWLCVTEIGFAYGVVLTGAMQGAGDTVRPLWLTIVSLWFLRIPMVFLLALPLGLGPTGAWIAMGVSQLLNGVFCALVFRTGRWKTQKV
ncbi:MAG: MATE family efflux transporter [Fimbriimonadales bacterium]|nr:MATE family efflux transporter [Fimbriimonadales bacterium]